MPTNSYNKKVGWKKIDKFATINTLWAYNTFVWAFTLCVPPRFPLQEEKDAPASQNLNLLLCLIVSVLFASI
jgi:hypothetical protein